jgi:hypothetical protein
MVYRFRYRFTGIIDRFIGFDRFQSLSADRFTGFDTGLPVISIVKSVTLTGLLILDFSNVKFEFGESFDRFL